MERKGDLARFSLWCGLIVAGGLIGLCGAVAVSDGTDAIAKLFRFGASTPSVLERSAFTGGCLAGALAAFAIERRQRSSD